MKKSLFYILLLSSLALSAQDELPSDTIQIFKEYKPVLADADRINISPDAILKDNKGNNGSAFNNYAVPERFITMDFEPLQAKPLAWKDRNRKGGDDGDYRLWVKTGFGNRLTPLVDISTHTGPSDLFNLGIDLAHISSHPKDYRDYLRSDARIYGTYFTNSSELSTTFKYDRDQYYYYGLPDTIENARAKQVYNKIGAQFGFKNSDDNSASINYGIDVDYQYVRDYVIADEHNIGLTADIRRGEGRILPGARFYVDYTAYDDTASLDNLVLDFTPTIGIQGEVVKLIVGASALLDQSDFYLFPHLRTELYINGGEAMVYAGWHKEVVKNNLDKYSDLNPFLASFLDYQNSVRENRYLGLRGGVGEKALFDLKVSQHITNDQPLFVNDTTQMERFRVLYEPEMKNFNIQPSLTYILGDKDYVRVGLNYLIYNLEEQAVPWHLPKFKINIGGRYTLTERINVTGELYSYMGAKARLSDLSETKIKPLFDLNIGFNYFLNQNISFFLDFNNISGINNLRYYNYPTYGVHLIGGLKFRL